MADYTSYINTTGENPFTGQDVDQGTAAMAQHYTMVKSLSTIAALMLDASMDFQQLTSEGAKASHAAMDEAGDVNEVSSNQTASTWSEQMSIEDAQKYERWTAYAEAGLEPADRVKLSNWDYAPDADLYIKYKEVYDNPDYFNQLTGEGIYPGTAESSAGRVDGSVHTYGFLNGEYRETALKPGTLVDRFGDNDTGRYFSPAGATFEERSLPPYMIHKPKTTYIVIREFSIKEGTVAPWFDEVGMGTQYFSDKNVSELEKGNYIIKVK